MYRSFFFIYQFFRAARHLLLFSVFGYVSHCKHTPTCGTFFWKTISSEGLVGLPKALSRVASCW